MMLTLLASPALRMSPVRMLAGPVLAPRSDGIRRELSTTGSPIPQGGKLPPDSLGWFDGQSIGSCVVKRFSNEMDGDRWMMWYSGRSGQITDGVAPDLTTGCVGFAQSKDGLVWERLAGDEAGGSCLAPNDESWWCFDTMHVGVGDVHVLSSKVVQNNQGLYWMYFFGGDANEAETGEGVGAVMSIGVALSNDGVHWGRMEGEHPSGAVLEPREGQLYVGWPQVIQVSNEPEEWRMYFHALNTATGKFEVGLASSPDGVRWEHEGVCLAPGPAGSFDEGGAAARCVVADPAADGHWLMFYEALDGARRRTIGLARSADGEAWVRGERPVLEPSDASWDSAAVGQPWLVPLDDESAMLYYRGEGDGASQGLGVARSDGADWTKWHRMNPDSQPLVLE